MMLENRVQSYAQHFSENDWLIYRYLKDVSEIEKLTIQGLAEDCHVSTTTVFRFCQKLNYSGFSELKASLLYTKSDRNVLKRDDFKKTYHQVVDYIDTYDTKRFFEAMKASDKIYLLARSELELRLAKDMQRIFFPLGKVMFILPNNQALSPQIDELKGGVLIVIRIDSLADFPLVLQNPTALEDTFVAVLSDFQEVPILANERFYIPNLYDDQLVPAAHITPFTLAVEMLYLKLQLN